MLNMLTFCSPDEELEVIDIAVNCFLYKQNHYTEKLVFDQAILLESFWIDNVKEKIKQIQQTFPNKWIGINMEYIHSCTDGRSFIGFATEIPNPSHVFFFGLLPGSDLQRRICSDISITSQASFFDEEYGILYLNSSRAMNGSVLLDKCNAAVAHYLEEIVKETISYRKDPELLGSSNIYVNCYVDMKRLFMHPEYLSVTIYRMARLLLQEHLDYDSLVCTSKNGAVLASLVGQLLNKNVIYCVSVGPQFAISAQTINHAFEPGKKYAYISDFICIGTEVKVLHALLSSRRAVLVTGVSVASYIPLDNPDLQNKHSPLAVISCLVNLIRAKIPYMIGVQKEELLVKK